MSRNHSGYLLVNVGGGKDDKLPGSRVYGEMDVASLAISLLQVRHEPARLLRGYRIAADLRGVGLRGLWLSSRQHRRRAIHGLNGLADELLGGSRRLDYQRVSSRVDRDSRLLRRRLTNQRGKLLCRLLRSNMLQWIANHRPRK